MSEIDMNGLLLQMRAMAGKAQGLAGAADSSAAPAASFSSLLGSAVNQVNQAQQSASQMAAAFETGSTEVDLAEVMVSLQKASLSFQAITQVRNRLVSAYQDIMNMPI